MLEQVSAFLQNETVGAVVVALVIGFLIGKITKYVLKVLVIGGLIVLVLYLAGKVKPELKIAWLEEVGPMLIEYGQKLYEVIIAYIPWTVGAFIIGFAVGKWTGGLQAPVERA